MKISKFNEKFFGLPVYNDTEEELTSVIYDLIASYSREIAAKEIVKYLIDNLTPEIMNEIQLKHDSKKYNL